MISDTDAADRMSGKNSEERKKVRNQSGILDCTRMASPSATASWMITAAMTKVIVLKNDTRTVGFAASSTKLSTPTNWGGVMMSHRKNARTTEPMIGMNENIPSPI